MVFRDLSERQKWSSDPIKKYHVPHVLDRLIAFVFDVIILSPIVGFFLFWILRDIKKFTHEGRDIFELQILWVLFILSYVILSTLILSTFTYKYKGSPGQLFLKLRVVPYPHKETQLRYSQCILRAAFFFMNFVLLGIPFFEIFSNPLRRVFHERVSETMVVTLKKEKDDLPLPIERRFFTLWLRYIGVAVSFVGAGVYYSLYSSVLQGDFKESIIQQEQESVCKNKKSGVLLTDLDASLVYYFLGEENRECIEEMVDLVFWGDGSLYEMTSSEVQLAYFASGALEEDVQLQDSYFSKVCQDFETDLGICNMAEAMKEQKKPEEFMAYKNQLKLTDYFNYKKANSLKDEIEKVLAIKSLINKGIRSASLDHQFLKTVWKINNDLKSSVNSSRRPASQKDSNKQELSQKIVNDFVQEMDLEK